MIKIISQKAPSITCRAAVTNPLLSGFTVIDSLVPVGRGQRELIIGDLGTGKSYLAKSFIMNQKRPNRYFTPDALGVDRVFCVYVAVGLRTAEVIRLDRFFKENGVKWFTSIVSATAGISSSWQYFAPFYGCTFAEIYRDAGYSTLVVYDTLTNHAIAHRQRSLLLKASPGREAYPADTFYTHARLLERATQLSKKLNYGSLTALPIIETLANNLTAYIPTNVISITDGQIFLSKKLSTRRIYPAVDVEKSVSRVGSKSQPVLLKAVTPLLRDMLNDYNTYRESLQLGYTLTSEEKIKYNKGCCAFNLCQQRFPRYFEEHIVLILASHMGLLCPNKTDVSISKVLYELYTTKRRWVLQLILLNKYKSVKAKFSDKFIINLVSYALSEIPMK